MGQRHSTFNKAHFKRGIRPYRRMFSALQLEEKELKKLWLEFGKIDRDEGGTVRVLSPSAGVLSSVIKINIRVVRALLYLLSLCPYYVYTRCCIAPHGMRGRLFVGRVTRAAASQPAARLTPYLAAMSTHRFLLPRPNVPRP